MSTREALESLIDGQAYDFRSKIEDELSARSLEAIQTKRFEVGASMFNDNDDVVEEELSTAEKQKRYQTIKNAAEKSKKNKELIKKAKKVEKLAKKDISSDPDFKDVDEETEQLDELSPKTLNSYADKAFPDIRRKSLDPKKREQRAKGVAKARFKAITSRPDSSS